MYTKNLALFLGVALSAGTLVAQQAPSQVPDVNAPQAAQGHPAQPHRVMNPGKQARHLAKRLGLNRDQVAQIKPILADRQQQVQALRANNSLAPQDRRAKMQAIQQDSKTRIETVLNDNQKQQFEQMLAQRRAHRRNQNQQTQPGQQG